MIKFHPLITMAEASHAANSIGCLLVPDFNGGAYIVPREIWSATSQAYRSTERHGNQNVVRLPGRLQRVNARSLPKPPGPEAA